MSTSISKRALSAGLGVGALALLAQTQRASADTSFTNFAFPASGTPTPRTMPDRLAEVVNVKDFGALGDGSTDDTAAIQAALNSAYGSSSSPHGRNYNLNKAVFFPAGTYKITSALNLTSVMGGHIFGAGRFATTIQNVTSGSSVFVTNGCQYSRFERLCLTASGPGSVCFDLDWNQSTTPAVALQSNTFSDMFFGNAEIGLRIGNKGYMGSENYILNCFFILNAAAGLKTCNFNALQQTVIGGNFQGCGIGIMVAQGSVPVVKGVGFQQSIQLDIGVYNGANDTMTITGCRTESPNFAYLNHISGILVGCTQEQSNPGTFVTFCNPGTLIGCISLNGQCDFQVGGSADNCQFARTDWLVSRVVPVYTRQLSLGCTWVEASVSGSSTMTNYGIGSWKAAVEGGPIYYLGTRLGTRVKVGALTPLPMTFKDLPSPANAWQGETVYISDSTTNTLGASITSGGGTYPVMAFCNGSAWKVAAS